jgi:hypothetical protein
MHRSHISKVPDSPDLYEAKLSGIPIDVSYMKYRLPSSAMDPPMKAELIVSPPCQQEAGKTLLICIPFAVDPCIEKGLLDVSVVLSLPPDIGSLLKTSHKATWAPSQSRLQWTFDALESGSQGVIRAVLSHEGSSLDYDTLVSHVRGTIVYSGYPGCSYSGLGFDISCGDGEYIPGKIRTFGELKI